MIKELRRSSKTSVRFSRTLTSSAANALPRATGGAHRQPDAEHRRGDAERNRGACGNRGEPGHAESYSSPSAGGIRSQERLIALIELGASAEAEAHWREHMAAVGKVILGQRAKTVIDLFDHY